MSELAEVEDHQSMMDGQLGRETVGGEEAHEVGPIRQVGVGQQLPLEPRGRRSGATCSPSEFEFDV